MFDSVRRHGGRRAVGVPPESRARRAGGVRGVAVASADGGDETFVSKLLGAAVDRETRLLNRLGHRRVHLHRHADPGLWPVPRRRVRVLRVRHGEGLRQSAEGAGRCERRGGGGEKGTVS